MQGRKEDPREFSRRVRSLGGVANRILGAQARDDMISEQFIDGFYKAETHELLLREEFENFSQAEARAQSLETARLCSAKTARARNRRLLKYFRELRGVPEL